MLLILLDGIPEEAALLGHPLKVWLGQLCGFQHSRTKVRGARPACSSSSPADVDNKTIRVSGFEGDLLLIQCR